MHYSCQWNLFECKKFLPVPHGETPKCARPGMTYCEDVHDYPKYVIKSLLDRWCYDFNTLFSNELPIDFNGNRLPVKSTKSTFHPIYPYEYYPASTNIQSIKHEFVLSNHSNINFYSKLLQQYSNNNFLSTLDLHTFNPIPYDTSFYNQLAQSKTFWQRLSHHRTRRSSSSKVKQLSKFIPKTQLFKELVTYKPPRKIDTKQFTENTMINVKQRRQRRVKRQNNNSNQLCTVQTEFVTPKVALNNQGNWKYVVNLDEPQYTQLVQSVVCSSQQCSQLCSLPQGYRSRCEQRYIQRRLVALEENGQRLETDLFWLPSCCVCTITNTN